MLRNVLRLILLHCSASILHTASSIAYRAATPYCTFCSHPTHRHPLLPESPMATTPSGSSCTGLELPSFHHDTFIPPFWTEKGKTYCILYMAVQKRYYSKSCALMNGSIPSRAHRVGRCVPCLRHFLFSPSVYP